MRIYAIPDIHGRFDLLEPLLLKLWSEEGLDLTVDKLIFLGDYIDRGPESKLVIDQIRHLQKNFPDNVIALLGNHEDICLIAHGWVDEENYKHDPMDIIWWLRNGGSATVKSFYQEATAFKALPDDYLNWMQSLKWYHKEEGFLFSHAPLPRDNRRQYQWHGIPGGRKMLDGYAKEEYIWTRPTAGDEVGVAKDMRPVIGVCGHNHQLWKGVREPRFWNHYYYLDAGCGCDRKLDKAPLIACEVKTKKVIYSYPPNALPKKEAVQ